MELVYLVVWKQRGYKIMTKQKQRGHGEGSIYQRPDGRWVGQITLVDGKRKYLYGKTRKEVADRLHQALQEQKQGLLATGPKQKLADYLEFWLEEVHKPAIKLTSYLRYRTLLTKHIIPDLGYIVLQKLSVRHIQSFYAKKVKEGLSAQTVHILHAILHKALHDAMLSNIVARNVSDNVSLPRIEKHETQTLTVQQAQMLFESVQGHPLEALFIMALTTGMRQGELIGLRWRDISFEHSSINIHRTVTYAAKRGFIISEPKTTASRRKIAISSFLIEVLKQHQAKQKEARTKARGHWKENDLVFCNGHGEFLHPASLVWTFRNLLTKAGLERIRFHDLRHSAATILLTMGVHPKVVQELLGHSTIRLTMDTYSHVLPSIQAEAIDKLGSLFQQQNEPLRDTQNQMREHDGSR
jgi:integrase